MFTRRHLLLGAAGPLVAGPALAAADSARAFVTAIYATYKGKDSKGVILDKAATIRRYFEPTLAAAMIKDQNAAAKRGEVGALDGDPFIDAQDWDIKAFNIAVAESAPASSWEPSPIASTPSAPAVTVRSRPAAHTRPSWLDRRK